MGEQCYSSGAVKVFYSISVLVVCKHPFFVLLCCSTLPVIQTTSVQYYYY